MLEVEDRAFTKMEVKMSELFEDTIEKAKFMCKLQVPEVFKQAKQVEQLEMIQR